MRQSSVARVVPAYELMALDLSLGELELAPFASDFIEGLVPVKILLSSCQWPRMLRILVSHKMPQILTDEAALILITWVLIPDFRLLHLDDFGNWLDFGPELWDIFLDVRVLGHLLGPRTLGIRVLGLLLSWTLSTEKLEHFLLSPLNGIRDVSYPLGLAMC